MRLSGQDTPAQFINNALIDAKNGDRNLDTVFEDLDLFADEFFQQLLRREQIVLVVLFENLQTLGIAQRLDMNGLRHNFRSHFAKP